MGWWLVVFSAGWGVQMALGVWRERVWRQRHAADQRVMRHLAEGQAELQKRLRAVSSDADLYSDPMSAAVRASREVH